MVAQSIVMFTTGLLLTALSIRNWRERRPTPDLDLKYGSAAEYLAPFLTFFGVAIMGAVVVYALFQR
jgi:hypothetical protein